MGKSFQQQSLQRKLTYFFLIALLFGATLFLRKQYVIAKAEDLGLRERDQGEVELTGSALRLTLTGSRGLVVCALWVAAQDKQMRNEWNDLELLVRTLTKLQPHFITPWLFQSWNLAYNVSVESDRIKDKYFYIASGINLLAEGERRNQDNPDLRHHLGIYYQSKIGLSDEQNTFRCLFQMSCIDPLERDATRFRPKAGDRYNIDLEELRKFAEAHPFLVRRLREQLNCQTPREVVDFLEANQKLPSRFQDVENQTNVTVSPLKGEEDRFPVLPPRESKLFPNEMTNDSDLPDDFNNFGAARAWFSYAQDPTDEAVSEPVRLPKMLTLIIFQGYPARAQAYLAERLQKEGWFDDEPWTCKDWFAGGPVKLGDPRRNWSGEAWQHAYQMYYDHGVKHHLYMTPEAEAGLVPMLRELRLKMLKITNFDHFLVTSEIEKSQESVKARKAFWEADRLYRRGDRSRALTKYEDRVAFGPPPTWTPEKATGWTRIFFTHPKFRNDILVQEDAYELELKYLDAVMAQRGPRQRRILYMRPIVAAVLAPSPAPAFWLPAVDIVASGVALHMAGPFDGFDERHQHWLDPEAVRVVSTRLGISQGAQPGPSGRAPAAPAQPGGPGAKIPGAVRNPTGGLPDR